MLTNRMVATIGVLSAMLLVSVVCISTNADELLVVPTDEEMGIDVSAIPEEEFNLGAIPEEEFGVSPLGCPDHAKAECADGYYACCWVMPDGCPRAKCYKNERDDSHCIAGGEGATACEVGRQRPEPEESEEIESE